MENWTFTIHVVIILGTCLFTGGIFSRLGQSPIVGYLLAGVILGGVSGAEILNFGNGIEAIAELGVALLLFSLGLEFSWGRIKRFGFKAIMIGVLQILVTGIVASVIS